MTEAKRGGYKLPVAEKNIQNLSLVAASAINGVYIQRNQTGVFKSMDGSRTVHIGVKGAADSLGFCSVVIDESWLGKRVPIFFAAEFKTARGSQRPDQKKWQAHIEKHGAPYALIRSPDEMKDFIESIKSGEAFKETGK